MNKLRLLLCAMLLSCAVRAGDTLQLLQPAMHPHKARIWSVTGTQVLLGGGSLLGLQQLWYADYPRQSFHIFNDNNEWLQMDKAGHALTAYALARLSAGAYRWAGVPAKRARWYGVLTPMLYLSGIEMLDGYSAGWGFSWGDCVANASGAALFAAQDALWQEQRIQMKFGFRRSGMAQYRPELLGSTWTEQLLKDYNGQTYWLSVNVASFLRSGTRFPRWLNAAVGYGAGGMTGGSSNPVICNAQGSCVQFTRYREFYLSADVDLTKLPVKQRWLKVLCGTFGWVKIPAPALVIANGRVRGGVW
ncbi:MAG: YfiM family protein [Bacteroidia bacterium]|jgi:hypothetical protein|nr:YfiM family protein [Bacteroidia bacterium]